MEEKCFVCGQTRRWHMEHRPHHVFSTTSNTPQLPKEEQAEPTRPRLQGDLVLRLTLLKKGLVSEAELEETRVWVEKAAEFGKAIILEPDPAAMTGWRYRLATEEQLIQEMVGNASPEV
jgi:hypothetical protein